jgi:hypothetical protein
MRRVMTVVIVALTAASVAARQPSRTRAPKLWTDAALKTWALPIAGVNATPNFYTEAEYYAARVDELRTYPIYLKDREPKGYREWMLKQGPKPLIETGKSRTDAGWAATGREVFDGMDLPENRTDDPRVLAWIDDPSAAAREHATVTNDGVIVSIRWVVDRDRKLKVTLAECSACHTRVLPDGTEVLGAQGNLTFSVSVFDLILERADDYLRRQGPRASDVERTYRSYAVPWLKDDVNARFKTMSKDDRKRIDGPPAPGTFARFNGSPYFTNHIPDLIGVRDRKYLDATATHRNRGPEDIARYGILVTDADDGGVGPHTFMSAADPAHAPKRRRDVRVGQVHLRAGAAEEPEPPGRMVGTRRADLHAHRLRELPRAAALHEQQAGCRRRLHARRASAGAAGGRRHGGEARPRPRPRAANAQGHRLLQSAVTEGPVVSNGARTFGIDRVTRGMVRSSAAA